MKPIGVVDLSTGRIAARTGDTLTLDIPSDLDWATGGVSVNASSLAHYLTSEGQRAVCAAMPTLLSARSRGNECLVADDRIDSEGGDCYRRYRLAAIDPLD